MVILKNVSRTMFVANLTHHSFREDAGPMGFKTVRTHVVDHDPKTGKLGRRVISRSLPSSLRVLAGEQTGSLPNSVLECPEVKNAIGGSLRIVKRTEEETPATKTESPAPVATPGPSSHPRTALAAARKNQSAVPVAAEPIESPTSRKSSPKEQR